MQRLFLVLILVAILVAVAAVILRAISRALSQARPDGASAGADRTMIQTGAYLALLALILGVSLGWLGRALDGAAFRRKTLARWRAGGIGRPPDAAPHRAGARRNFLFIAPLPLLFSAFAQGALGMALDLAALAVLLLAAWLLTEGLKAEDAWAARKIARRPGIPRKMFASALTGIGVALAAFSLENGLVAPVILGIVAIALHVTAFGVDPMRDKGMEGVTPSRLTGLPARWKRPRSIWPQ